VTRLFARLLSELLGTTLLLAIVIGSGIMAERLADGNNAIALLANTAATVGGLFILIEVFGPISGAHFNPAVSMVMVLRKQLQLPDFMLYVLAQMIGAALGAWLAHAMFDLPILQMSSKIRWSEGQWLAEVVATAGLLWVILRAPSAKISSMVACYIGAAYWFTSSTSFANPAAVFGRMLSNTFAGIDPHSALPFMAAEIVGALLALVLNQIVGEIKNN
jgi:glycerol uptake facilitator-like aquaporin